MGSSPSKASRPLIREELCDQVMNGPIDQPNTTLKANLQVLSETSELPYAQTQYVCAEEPNYNVLPDHRLESAESALKPTFTSDDADVITESETEPIHSFYEESSGEIRETDEPKRRRSSQVISTTSTSDDEGLHPETRQRVYKKRSGRYRTSLTIHDRELAGALEGSGLAWPRSYEHEGKVLSPTTIFEPYEPLFHNRRRLSEISQKPTCEVAQHAKYLLDFMRRVRHTTWDKGFEIEERTCQNISFEDSWLLYRPGETVFCRDDAGWRAYKVDRLELGARLDLDPMKIHAHFLDYDETGTQLVPHPHILTVSAYRSENPVGRLEVLPEWFIEKYMEALPNVMIQRGRKYWAYNSKPFYQEYTGDAWQATPENNAFKVMIDYATSSKHNRDNVESSLSNIRPHSCSLCLGEVLKLGPFPRMQSRHNADFCVKTSTPVIESDTKRYSDDRLLLYCPSTVWAFSLQHKTWKRVHVQSLVDVKPQENALEQLLMNEEKKTEIDSMANAFFSQNKANRYAMTGKPSNFGSRSSGLNILLNGGPGTGKTFTAECLARKYGRPLYRITCGNLGTDILTLDNRLWTTFLRAANWDAILLLEEADIFFLERHHSDLKRGPLVSIFLQHLERSAALALITTSLHSRHDISLGSRIHLPVILLDLRFGGQKTIWLNHIMNLALSDENRAKLKSFIEYDLENLDEGAHQDLNGLEIESCMRAALALAKKEQNSGIGLIPLRQGHITKLLRLRNDFREHMIDMGDLQFECFPE